MHGIQPAAFDVDRAGRPAPYPGGLPFGEEDADAATFFGRARELEEVSRLLDELHRSERSGFLVITAAAGVGKTSFVRAGLLPRLRRAPERWVVLPTVVSECGPSLVERMNAARSRLEAGGARPLLCIDPGRLLLSNRPGESPRLQEYLEEQLALQGQVIVTLRPEQLEDFETRFRGLSYERYHLRSIPTFRFDEVIAGPAQRYEAPVDSELVDALMEDAPSQDALPVLALALQRLWSRGGARLQLSDYLAAGKIRGLVEEVAEAALGTSEWDQEAKRTFVPALLDLDDDGMLVSNIAKGSSFDARSEELLRRFEAEGLVRRSPSTDTVEVTHPAIFRLWPRLEGWFSLERSKLATRLTPRSAAELWHQRGRRDEDLLHSRGRLGEALRDSGSSGSIVEQDYLRRCRERDERRNRRRLRITSAAALIAVLLGGLSLRAPILAWARDRVWVRPFVKAHFEAFRLTADEERGLAPGDAFRECASRCPEMVVVPPGSFMMGDAAEKDGSALPRHRVDIRRSFAVGRTEVTFEQYETCVEFGDCPRHYDLGDIDFDRRRPVNFITHAAALPYVRWLSEVTGRSYRLLSAAEWEYAARAGTETTYWWGDTLEPGRLHCYGCGSPFEADIVTSETGVWLTSAPVASFPANPFGLHDMLGNVWELVSDCWHPNYRGAPSDGSPWRASGQGKCDVLVMRGGGAQGGAQTDGTTIRPSIREWMGRGMHELGFRVARDLAPSEP